MLTLCCGTWKRYDLLNKLINSAEGGHTAPDKYVIFDNGNGFYHDNPKVEIWRSGTGNIGISGALNFILHQYKSDEYFKVIPNDDVELFPYTLTMFVQHRYDGDFLVTGGLPILNAFTLFSVNEKVLNTVGYFDESISPRYAYFEDNDYGRRIHLAGLKRFNVPTSAYHEESGTLKVLTGNEKSDHSRKFDTARNNYKSKWGGIPPFETTENPHGGLYCSYHDKAVIKIK